MARNGDSRSELIRQVIRRKEQLWGQGDRKFRSRASAANVRHGVPKGNQPPKELLRWAAYEASDSELISAAGSGDLWYGFLYYK